MENLLKISGSVEETRLLGKQLAHDIKGYNRNIFLFGELGAGKTTFLKGLGAGLGIEEDITSQTFQLVRKYENTGGNGFIHVDLYRLKDIDEILHLGWWDMLEDEAVTAVEWADRAYEILPEEGVFLKITMVSEKEREIGIYRKKEDLPRD